MRGMRERRIEALFWERRVVCGLWGFRRVANGCVWGEMGWVIWRLAFWVLIGWIRGEPITGLKARDWILDERFHMISRCRRKRFVVELNIIITVDYPSLQISRHWHW
jgi:hypothetical protein